MVSFTHVARIIGFSSSTGLWDSVQLKELNGKDQTKDFKVFYDNIASFEVQGWTLFSTQMLAGPGMIHIWVLRKPKE